MMVGFLPIFLLSTLHVQGVAGKKGVMLVFDAFQPAGIQEVGLLFLPSRGTSSGDPLARKVCSLSGKASSVCPRAHTVRVKRFSLPPERLQDTVMWVMKDGWKRGAGEVGLWIRGVDGNVEVGWLKEGVGLQVVADTFRWPFAGYDPGQSYTYPWGVYPDVNVLWCKPWNHGHIFVTGTQSAVSEGRLYMADGGNVLEVMDVETGEVLDSVEMVSNVNAAALIGDSLLVVASTFGTLEPEKDTTLKLFRLPDLELVWGMTGLKAVNVVGIIGDTIVTGGGVGVTVITRDGKEIHQWPMEAWTQTPILVQPNLLVGWESPDGYHYTLVVRHWPNGQLIWRKDNLRFGWFQWSSQRPSRFWIMMLDSLLGVSVKTWEEYSIPSIPDSYPILVNAGPWWLVAEGTWREDGNLDGIIRVFSALDMRPVDTVRVYLGMGGVGFQATAGIRSLPAVWWLAEYGYVLHVKEGGTTEVNRLGRMPGPWDTWQGYVDGSTYYPVLYRNMVIQITRLGRYVLRGRNQPPARWLPPDEVGVQVWGGRRFIRVQVGPETRDRTIRVLDLLGRQVFRGKVKEEVVVISPLTPGIYRVLIGRRGWTIWVH